MEDHEVDESRERSDDDVVAEITEEMANLLTPEEMNTARFAMSKVCPSLALLLAWVNMLLQILALAK